MLPAMNTPPPGYVGITAAAARTCLSERTIWRRALAGEITPVKYSPDRRFTLFRISELDALVEETLPPAA